MSPSPGKELSKDLGKELSNVPDSGRSDYFEVRVASLPAPVRVQYSAIRDLRMAVDAKADGLGLLLGSSSPQAISIQRCELLALSPATLGDPKSLQGAFRQFIRARLQTPLEDAPALLGCFRTQTAGWPSLRDSDLEIAKKNFPGLDALFLVVQTPQHRPWLATLYALDGKTETASAQLAHEFPFDEYLLRNGYVSALVEAEQPPAPLAGGFPGRQYKGRWTIAAIVLALLLIGGTAAYKWYSPAGRAVAGRSTTAAGTLNLKVNRSGKDFEISWDLLSAAIQQASNGRLTIQDGALARGVTLTGAQLREGRILYTPLFDELTFRLEVAAPNQDAVAESVQVLAWSGKQPADVLVVDPNPSATGSVARIIANEGAKPLSSMPPGIFPESPRRELNPPTVGTGKAAPGANKGNQPPSAGASSVLGTATVIPPSPSKAAPVRESAPVPPPRSPDPLPPTPTSAPPAVVPERPPAIQTSPQLPVSPPPSQAPRAPAPQSEAPPTPQNSPPPATATPSPSSTASARVAATPPVPVQRVTPILPRTMSAATPARSGTITVSVRMMVDSAGSVQSAQVTASTPKGVFGESIVHKAALEAAKSWKFRPGQLNGKNVAAEYDIDFKF